MPCNNILTNDISTACDSVKGIYSEVWIIPYAEANVLFDGDKVVFLSSAIQNEFRKISAHKFALNVGADIEASEVTKNQYLHFFGAMINDPLGLIDDVDGIILIAREMGTDKLYCFGAKNGLYKSSQTSRSNDNRGMKAVEFMSRAEIGETLSRYEFAPLIPFETLLQLETTGGLSVGSGTQKIYLEVDSDKTAYAIMPNGTIYTSVAGVINQNYSGGAGRVTLAVPKNSSRVGLSASGVSSSFTGVFKGSSERLNVVIYNSFISGIEIMARNAQVFNNINLLNLKARISRVVSCQNCPKLPISNLQSIIDDVYSLWLGGVAGSEIIVNMGGTTVAWTAADLAKFSPVDGDPYSEMINSMQYDGATITYNTI